MRRPLAAPMAARRRRSSSAAPRLLLLLPLLLALSSTRALAAPPTSSSALLVVDPQPGDPCSRTPGECGTLDSCASAFRVDVLANGTAVITPAGPDYTLNCATDFNAAYPTSQYSFDPRVPARGSVRVRCSAMTGSGAEGAWPPAKKNGGGGDAGKQMQQQQPALVFDKFAQPEFEAKGQDGKPMPGGGTVSHSLLSGPDSKMTASALFNRRAFHSASCYPFYCPTPGCSMGRPSALVVIRVADKGSGRVQVLSAERQFTCDRWDSDYFCARELVGFSYRIVEGAVLGEKAQATSSKLVVGKDSCPVGTGPAKINVPPPAGSGGGGGGGVAAGPRDACVSACDGAAPGAKGTREASAIVYDPSGAPTGGCRACPSGFLPKGAACAACAGWQGPCCAPGFGPGVTKDCPACPSSGPKKAFARLRLASVVAPNPAVQCLDFFRAGAGDLAAAVFPGYLDDEGKAKAAADCPPRELTLSVNDACGVEMTSLECPMLDTAKPEYWQGPGRVPDSTLGTLPFNLTSAGGGGGAAAWALRTKLLTRLWTERYGQEDGNVTVAALEPSAGPAGRGLLALRLNPVGCVFRYSVVEGALPGGQELAAAGGAPLPAAASWCPGNAPTKGAPVKLKDGEVVPVCVMGKQ